MKDIRLLSRTSPIICFIYRFTFGSQGDSANSDWSNLGVDADYLVKLELLLIPSSLKLLI